MSETQPSPVALRIAAGLVGLLLVGVVVLSQVLGDDGINGTGGTDGIGGTASPGDPATRTGPPRTGPVPLVPVDAPQAGSAECTGLTGALPDELPNGDDPLRRLPIADPAPAATAAWGTDRGEPVVLRCGLSRPPELTSTTVLRKIDDVQWLTVPGAGGRSWYVVDRPVYVAVTVPDGVGPGPLQELSATVTRALDAVPVRPR